MKRLFNEVSREFLDNMDVRDNSRELYKRVLNRFVRWVVYFNKNISKLKRSDIIEYKSYLLKSCMAENTIDLYLTVVRRFYEYAELVNEHENIAAGIRLTHKRIGFRKEHLSHNEIEQLMNSLENDTLIGKRDYAIINLMLRSGMRCVELSRMRVCDIYINNDECNVLIQRKGDNARTERLGLTIKAIAPVMDYLAHRGVADEIEPVFVTHCSTGENQLTASRISRIVKGHMVSSGIYSKTKTTHSLRHTTAVLAIINKVPIKEVQLMLGHRKVETTEIYLKSIDDTLRLSNPAVRAIDNLF